MSAVTSLTRMWLTRSVQPFRFTNDNDRQLPFQECSELGLYIHIPFCRQLCSFCPYCKQLYAEKDCNRYIDSLIQEIHMVGGQNHGKKTVTSLYFGGGTPALAAGRLKEIIDAVRTHFTITEGIGAELHPDNLTIPLLQTLKAAGISKISIGIQSFQPRLQKLLGRSPLDTDEIQAALNAVPFETVSMDFIFALPGQTFPDLKADIDTAFACGANHIAVYPFIDFTFTANKVAAMPKKEKRKLLDAVTEYCLRIGCRRSSIWTFCKGDDANYSSMTRSNFLGFGCSAATLLQSQFKINTFSVESYCRKIEQGLLPSSLTLRFSQRQRMVYYLFWTAYSTEIHAADFEAFFGLPLRKMYGLELELARLLGFLTKTDGVYRMTKKGAFYYHYYENFYTLSYIDKMWGILRTEAFPERLVL